MGSVSGRSRPLDRVPFSSPSESESEELDESESELEEDDGEDRPELELGDPPAPASAAPLPAWTLKPKAKVVAGAATYLRSSCASFALPFTAASSGSRPLTSRLEPMRKGPSSPTAADFFFFSRLGGLLPSTCSVPSTPAAVGSSSSADTAGLSAGVSAMKVGRRRLVELNSTFRLPLRQNVL